MRTELMGGWSELFVVLVHQFMSTTVGVLYPTSETVLCRVIKHVITKE